MPQLSSTIQTIRTQLHADLRTATGASTLPISRGNPRKEQMALPRATVAILEAAGAFGQGAAKDLTEALVWGIRVYLPMPTDDADSGEDACLDVYDAFVLLLEANPHYAGIGHFPHVAEKAFDLSEEGSEEECIILDMKVAMTVHLPFGS